MESHVMVVIVLSVLILSGVAIILMGMQSRRQIREMEHRERLAMIERGLVPPPEVDPGAFEEGMERPRIEATPGSVRSQSAGIMMIGLGLAFMFLVSVAAGAPEAGIGVGGAFALLGVAFFVNSVMLSRHQPPRPAARARLPRTEPPAPPPNV